MKVTRGMQRRDTKSVRKAAMVGTDTLIAGVDLAKKTSVVVFMRASDRAPLGRLRIPTSPAGLARSRELVWPETGRGHTRCPHGGHLRSHRAG